MKHLESKEEENKISLPVSFPPPSHFSTTHQNVLVSFEEATKCLKFPGLLRGFGWKIRNFDRVLSHGCFNRAPPARFGCVLGEEESVLILRTENGF